MRKIFSVEDNGEKVKKPQMFVLKGFLIALFLTGALLPCKADSSRLVEILNQIVSVADMPSGFRYERDHNHTSKRGDYLTASVDFKGKHPFTIVVQLIQHPHVPSTTYLYDQWLKTTKDDIISSDLGIGEKSYHISWKLGSKTPVSQSINVYWGNWRLNFRMSWYSHREVKAYTDEGASAFIRGLAAQVFNRFLAAVESPVEVVPFGGDLEGNELADGDVVLLIKDFNNPEPLQIEIRGKPSGSEAGQSHEVQLRMKSWHKELISLSGPELEETTYGYSFETTDRTNLLTLSFDANCLREYRELFPGGPAVVVPLTVGIGKKTKSFFVQLSPWQLMVTRFEIRERGSESTREFNARRQRRPEEDYRFNDYIALKGKLWDSWIEILFPMVKKRPQGEIAGEGNAFGPNEAVVMGWAVNEETGHNFVTAEDDPSGGQGDVLAYRAEADLYAEFDLEIVLDPKAQTKKEPADGEWVMDEDTEVSDVEEQPEIWRDFRVDEFEITVHEVDPEGMDMRLTAGSRYAVGGPVATKTSGREEISDYVKRKMIDRFSREVMYEGDIPVYRFGPLRKPGTYEVRLYMKVTRKADLEDFREVEVAARIPVKRSDFGIRVIHWTSQRGKVGRQ